MVLKNWHLRVGKRERKKNNKHGRRYFCFHFQQERRDGDDEDVDEKGELGGPFSVSTWITMSPTRRGKPSINCSSIR